MSVRRPRYSVCRAAAGPKISIAKPKLLDVNANHTPTTSDTAGSEWKRSQVTSELFSSEKAYMDHLDVLLKVFVDPLSRRPTLVPPASYRTLFSELRSIRLVNQVLFDHLCKCDVATAFAALMPYLKLYASYARNFPASQRTLEDLMTKSSEFASFVHTAEDSEAVGGLKLPALLIMPIQRIPRYRLLLNQLIAHSDRLEAQQLKAIVEQLNEVAEHVNECVRDYENSMQIMQVQRQLDSCAPSLLVPGRRLIKHGILIKLSRKQPGQHLFRHFWLFTDVLLYAKAPPTKRIQRSAKLQCCCVMPLRHCTVERTYGTNTFTITCRSECITVSADSYAEVVGWIDALAEAIKAAMADRQTLRKESSRRPVLHRSMLRRLRKRASTLTRRQVQRREQQQQAQTPAGKSECLPNKKFARVLGEQLSARRQATRVMAKQILNRALCRQRSNARGISLTRASRTRQSTTRRSSRTRASQRRPRQPLQPVMTPAPAGTRMTQDDDSACSSPSPTAMWATLKQPSSHNNNHMVHSLEDEHDDYADDDGIRRRSYDAALAAGEVRLSLIGAQENAAAPAGCRLSTVTEEGTYIASEHNLTVQSMHLDASTCSPSPRGLSSRAGGSVSRQGSSSSTPWWAAYETQQRSEEPPPKVSLFNKLNKVLTPRKCGLL